MYHTPTFCEMSTFATQSLLFSEIWLDQRSGLDLIILQDTMPALVQVPSAIFLTAGSSFDCSLYPFISKQEVQYLSRIPDAVEMARILQHLKLNRRVSHVVIPELHGTFVRDAISMLHEVQRTRSFTDSLVMGLGFIRDTVSSIDDEFSRWLDDELTNMPDIYVNAFRPSFYLEGVESESVLSFCNLHADKGVLDGIMALFRHVYGQNNRIAFLPAQYHLSDGPDEFITRIRTRAVYVPVAVKGHWSVIGLDLLNYDIYFGDPYVGPAPRDIVDSLFKWLRPTGNNEHYWECAKENIKTFPVSSSDGSTDTLAAVAIERQVNRIADWDGLTVNGNRTRYMKLLTGYITVSDDWDESRVIKPCTARS
ncbi:MAG: hypothetical protein J3Q66DRAFT_359310 [Benniella sp.]|nr:MAG: hypothetical protein J3Q66DRAFT_359310 [Benniella sp.]